MLYALPLIFSFGDIMKRIISIMLVIIITVSVACQCSLTSSAVIGIDDALLIGTVCLDLAAMGITFYSVSEFVQSDTFSDFCMSIGNDIDEGIEAVKYQGKLYYATSRLAWQGFCNWVKSKFTGKSGLVNYEYGVLGPPHYIQLTNGVNVPYNDFMAHPFFIYYRPATGLYHAYNCTGSDVGAIFLKETIQIYSMSNGKVQHYSFREGDVNWTYDREYNMLAGASYKGGTGYLYNLRFASGSQQDDMSSYLYRTMDKILNTSGVVDTSNPVQTVPEETNQTANVQLNVDDKKIPGSVQAPTEKIAEGQKVLIEVPEQLIVYENGEPTLTTNITNITQYLSTVTSDDVVPKVLTEPLELPTVSHEVQEDIKDVVDDVVTDTDVPEIENPTSDEATVNKFRLPRSFLEGFPFSIPYSIYVGIRSLIATPEVPSFNFHLNIPHTSIDETFNVDLSRFSDLAVLCRSLLAVVWVAGFAFASYKFFK